VKLEEWYYLTPLPALPPPPVAAAAAAPPPPPPRYHRDPPPASAALLSSHSPFQYWNSSSHSRVFPPIPCQQSSANCNQNTRAAAATKQKSEEPKISSERACPHQTLICRKQTSGQASQPPTRPSSSLYLTSQIHVSIQVQVSQPMSQAIPPCINFPGLDPCPCLKPSLHGFIFQVSIHVHVSTHILIFPCINPHLNPCLNLMSPYFQVSIHFFPCPNPCHNPCPSHNPYFDLSMSQTFPYFDLSMSQNFSIFQIHVLIYISRALKTRSRSMSKSQPMFHVSIHVHVQVSTNVSCLNSCPCPSLNQCFMSQSTHVHVSSSIHVSIHFPKPRSMCR